MKNKIYDCITFYQANSLFQIRFEVLKDFVDYFVVCEADKTHTGSKKKFNFNPKIPNEYKSKIIYIKVTNLPNIKIKGKKDYKLLSLQMENLFRGIESANPNDLIIFSDEDEIPNPKIIANYDFEKYKYGIFLQNMYYYKLNIMNIDEGNNNWPGPRICLKKNLKSFFKLKLLKVKNINYPFWRIDKEKSIQLIKTGGWHFTYLMKPKEIAKKIEDMAHTEFNKPEFKDISFIENNIKKLNDPFNRNLKLKKVEIDDSYPVYIQKNKDFFNEWILE
jgi:beta-1,4-mannosyl-glycoprotein beta-1,4-N-acetylglucosaminyltransferase|tara:strand:+ start:299 stop:1126 length:828 start_codon:yes stop_codon:yes gene_type:complete